MRNFQDTFETRKQSFISAFSICMTVSIIIFSTVFFSIETGFHRSPVLISISRYIAFTSHIINSDIIDYTYNPFHVLPNLIFTTS